MNRFLIVMSFVGVASLIGFGGCTSPVSQYDDAMRWMSMRRSPLYMRYHPDRWVFAGTHTNGPGCSKHHISLQHLLSIYYRSASGFEHHVEPWFREKTQYGPFTVLRDHPLGLAAILLDEDGKPLWAGTQIIPMHMKGKLKSLVLVEEIPRPRDFQVGLCPAGSRADAPFYRFVILDIELITGGQIHRCPLQCVGIGFLVDLWWVDRSSHVMDVSGKGDDLLGMVMLGAFTRWDGILSSADVAGLGLGASNDAEWILVAIDAWGRQVLGAGLPKGAKPLNVSIIVETSPKITLSASKNGADGAVWKKVTYDPGKFRQDLLDD